MSTAQITSPFKTWPQAQRTAAGAAEPAAQSRAVAATEPEIDRTSIYISSVLATTIIFFLGVAIPCWYAFNLAVGLGLGGMCAFWGGPGFGVMVGAGRVLLIEEKRGIHPPHP